MFERSLNTLWLVMGMPGEDTDLSRIWKWHPSMRIESFGVETMRTETNGNWE
jgi:hypothetical protein